MSKSTVRKPLLTVGVPTYNRAHLLNDLLALFAKQVNELADSYLVEVVISDNDSTDNTREVVNFFSSQYDFVRYHKNEKNIGANNNILKIGYELALGEYCWIIGDDDLVRNNAIKNILLIIKGENVPGVIYLNHTNEFDDERAEIINVLPIRERNLMCTSLEDAVFVNAQEILSLTKHNSLFTSLSSFIFSTKIWHDKFIGYQVTENFSTLDNTFPHSVILSKHLMTERVYYVGYPYLAFFIGAQNWFIDWKFLFATRVLEYSKLLENQGASAKFLEDYRKRIFDESTEVYALKIIGGKFPSWFNLDIMKNVILYYKYSSFQRLMARVSLRTSKSFLKMMIGRS